MCILVIEPFRRNIRYTPAVTKVDEWTKDDTGVGAAIAAGSHALKGNWALFVKEAIIIAKNIKGFRDKKFLIVVKFKEGYIIKNAKEPIIRASPIRLLMKVIMPELYDLGEL